ncbi:hypothetical protein L873DRAFT_1818314 [Choiromyces venosus 120613-1]|uniref:Uncharacterized protein n=1 Tax=Choiromyces venosus 120613-1 TaxID=1336337 RepID=A0A3N4J176_9PEZI|nr:hypothetical protein L873DRAFT_1818314 [Choiromyces venosus 120613-1]
MKETLLSSQPPLPAYLQIRSSSLGTLQHLAGTWVHRLGRRQTNLVSNGPHHSHYFSQIIPPDLPSFSAKKKQPPLIPKSSVPGGEPGLPRFV